MMLMRSRRSLTTLLVASLALATACDDDETTGPLVPRNLAKVSGDPQTGLANFPTPEPLVVKVTAADGTPVPGVTVTFATSAPGASVSTAEVETDNQGQASTSWTLGPAAGEQKATATVANVGTVEFTATVASAQVLYAVPSAGVDQIGLAGQALLQPVTVTVIGSNNAPIAGVPVAFAVTSGGGTLSAAEVVTDANGQATINWTLGAVNGAQTISATVPGYATPIVFTATADPCLFQQPFEAAFTGELGGLDCQVPPGKFADLFAIPPTGTPQAITVTSDAFEPYLTLLAGTDTLGFGDAAAANATSMTVLVGPGARISVTSADAGATGAYTIAQEAVPDVTGCALVYATSGAESAQQITPEDCAFPASETENFYSDDYTVFLKTGQTLTVTQAPEALDAFLILFDADFNDLATQDAGGGGDAETLEFTAEEDGFYIIDAGTFDPEEVGPYTISIEIADPEPEAPAAP
jgi:hypothetical protein